MFGCSYLTACLYPWVMKPVQKFLLVHTFFGLSFYQLLSCVCVHVQLCGLTLKISSCKMQYSGEPLLESWDRVRIQVSIYKQILRKTFFY